MELERIKQNLRLRSGRSKKTRKQPVVPSNPGAHAHPPNQKNIPNGDVREPTKPTTQSSPVVNEKPAKDTNSEGETTKPAPNGVVEGARARPSLPHASTGLNSKPSTKTQYARFGRSGIERPRRDPPKELALLRTMSENDSGGAKQEDDSSSALDFDLRPPPPRPKPPSTQSLSEALFSSCHLNVLLRDPSYLARFTSFLTKYRPQFHPVLLRYLETQKAIKAIEYANAVAEGVPLPSESNDQESSIPRASVAAVLDKRFEESSTAAFRLLVDSALPMYVTYNLVKLVSECLINEITGRQTLLMRDLVGGLSEVFCLSDPTQEDNPIIYASEEFYRYTGYGSDDVIGRNCRFLQGSKTKRESVARLREAIGKGEGVYETLLNYRRDGRPFINLLMIAPLHDDKGNVKYHIGAQVDVTGLVTRAKGLDGFAHYLFSRDIERREEETRSMNREGDEGFRKPRALAKLRELSEMFDLEESAVVRSHSRSASASGDEDERSIGSSRKSSRRVLGDSDATSDNDDEDAVEDEDKTWKLGESGRSGLSGKLPGVYETFMLIRPVPSLRIIFVSPKLRRRLGNVLQHLFLSHVAASTNTLKGLKESFSNGVPVSAKVNLLLEAGERRDGTTVRAGSRMEDVGRGRVCWLSATPMLGSDDKIGVWMIVVVEKSKVPMEQKQEPLARSDGQMPQQPKSNQTRPSQKSARLSYQQESHTASSSPPKESHEAEDLPIKPKKLEDNPEPVHDAEPSSANLDQGHVNKSKDAAGNQDHQQGSSKYTSLLAKGGREGVYDMKPDPEDSIQLVSFQNAEDEYVETTTKLPASERSTPVDVDERIDDEEDEEEESSNTADNATHEPSEPENNHPKARVQLESPEDEDRDEDSNLVDNVSDGEDTVRNHQAEEDSDGSPSPPRPGTNGMDSTSGMNKNYMDYLRHPGSRPSAEYTRNMSASFLSGKYEVKDEEQGERDDFDDVECARSPYSVD